MRLLRNSRCSGVRVDLFLHDVVVHPDDLCNVGDRVLGNPFVAPSEHVADLAFRGQLVECLVVSAFAALAECQADVGTGTLEHGGQCGRVFEGEGDEDEIGVGRENGLIDAGPAAAGDDGRYVGQDPIFSSV